MKIDLNNQAGLTLDDFIAQRSIVLGISGSGKTNTAAVIIEELLPHIPMTIIDIEGEYWGLTTEFRDQLIVVGNSDHADIPRSNPTALSTYSYAERQSVILDLSDLLIDEVPDFVTPYLTTLWENATVEMPYHLVVEEAHELVPQSAKTTPLSQLLRRIALRGRKRGLGSTLITQRPANIHKDAISQAQIGFLHQVTYPTDMKVYKDILPNKSDHGKIPTLNVGSCILTTRAGANPIAVRLRTTYHPSYTPGADSITPPSTKPFDSAMLEKLQALLSSDQPDNTTSNEDKKTIAALRATNEALERDKQDLQQQVSDLSKQLETLGHIKIAAAPSKVNFPKQVEVHSMTVGEIHTNGTASDDPPSQPQQKPLPLPIQDSPTQSEIATSKTFFSERSLKRRKSQQQRRFQLIKSGLQNLDNHHRAALQYLMEVERQWREINEIARMTGYATGTFVGKPLTPLLKMNLIERQRRSRRHYYISRVRKFFDVRIPPARHGYTHGGIVCIIEDMTLLDLLDKVYMGVYNAVYRCIHKGQSMKTIPFLDGLPAVAADMGNEQFKALSVSERPLERILLHAVAEISKHEFENVAARTPRGGASRSYIKWRGRYFVVGEDALLHDPHIHGNRQTGIQKYQRDYIGVALMAMLLKLYGNRLPTALSVMVGHPPKDIAFREDIIRAFKGKWSFHSHLKKHKVEIKHVVPTDEIMGGAMNVALDADGYRYDGNPITGKRTLVVDLGGGTMDVMGIDRNGYPEYPTLESATIGVNRLLLNFKQLYDSHPDFQHTLKDTVSGIPMRSIYDCFRYSRVINGDMYYGIPYAGDMLDVTEIAEQVTISLLNEMYQALKNKIQGAAINYQYVIITGGGGDLFFEPICQHLFPQFLETNSIARADEPGDTIYANVRGMSRMIRHAQESAINDSINNRRKVKS